MTLEMNCRDSLACLHAKLIRLQREGIKLSDVLVLHICWLTVDVFEVFKNFTELKHSPSPQQEGTFSLIILHLQTNGRASSSIRAVVCRD